MKYNDINYPSPCAIAELCYLIALKDEQQVLSTIHYSKQKIPINLTNAPNR